MSLLRLVIRVVGWWKRCICSSFNTSNVSLLHETIAWRCVTIAWNYCMKKIRQNAYICTKENGFFLEAAELFSVANHAVSLYDNFHIKAPCVEVSRLRSNLRVFFSPNSQVFIDIFSFSALSRIRYAYLQVDKYLRDWHLSLHIFVQLRIWSKFHSFGVLKKFPMPRAQSCMCWRQKSFTKN